MFNITALRAQDTTFLRQVRSELQKTWPHNRAVNLVFHGHSVPAGYFATPVVNTLEAYPQQVLKGLKEKYPNAVINVIVTAIGGENSVKGAERFSSTVLIHQPDVLFIDYALNDRAIGLEKARAATEQMIREAQAQHIPVILLTPSPDISTDWKSAGNPLRLLRDQIVTLAKQYKTGLLDTYDIFLRQADVKPLMAQNNHPNEKGHRLIAEGILHWF
ncbi:SGNH/GDSL hydrolase family protein [Chitinophaga barathri]|uniref:SGNH/GDSL hydrolase family protein n=2 Tax=Chitinophaga barathri TaxID=1647451 RepID=A0A3N4MQ07_9BACT|nr:SGNH/GDSL hydrolase family protein [Chitinophaga barathri]